MLQCGLLSLLCSFQDLKYPWLVTLIISIQKSLFEQKLILTLVKGKKLDCSGLQNEYDLLQILRGSVHQELYTWYQALKLVLMMF